MDVTVTLGESLAPALAFQGFESPFDIDSHRDFLPGQLRWYRPEASKKPAETETTWYLQWAGTRTSLIYVSLAVTYLNATYGQSKDGSYESPPAL
ncbi:hypothetical protein THAOC_21427 [Thalassiosira oceanica]|uniref:Uncharacterized protein n=1 Tax=Thalassiosira oceanica TaxID=159749 RepID=K0S119_THAOC|nr:hypothetical protein THAOC_21427 [Thalassiosira oceanica]|eukprot:EJK58449.1 hypothetical protein THAOC_21427 [Thalassiosira oceanica]